jgi:hypothetical protein
MLVNPMNSGSRRTSSGRSTTHAASGSSPTSDRYLHPGCPTVGHRLRHSAEHFGIPWQRYRLIGVAELAAAVGVLAGLHWPPLGWRRPWGCSSSWPVLW